MRALSIIALALALAAAPSAEAASKRERAQAKRLTKRAGKHFKAKRFEKARSFYQRAYELVPLPALRFNIGQCDLALERWESAITEFKTFLAATPDTPYAADVRKLIADARRELAKRAPPPPPPEPVASPEPDPVDAPPERDPTPAVAVAPSAGPPPAPPPPIAPPPVEPPVVEEESSVLGQWWLWAIVGGVALAAGGTAIALSSGGERTVLPMGDLGVIDRRGASR
jgi:tetratricopeptide (TPR) repeat protein